jgi:hypothetical protein
MVSALPDHLEVDQRLKLLVLGNHPGPDLGEPGSNPQGRRVSAAGTSDRIDLAKGDPWNEILTLLSSETRKDTTLVGPGSSGMSHACKIP